MLDCARLRKLFPKKAFGRLGKGLEDFFLLLLQEQSNWIVDGSMITRLKLGWLNLEHILISMC